MLVLRKTMMLLCLFFSCSPLYATTYYCPDPSLIKVSKDPTTHKVTWSINFGSKLFAIWDGKQTEPTRLDPFPPLNPGTITAIRLDYGVSGNNWPIPRLTCYYLGDNKKTASGFISSSFFDRSATTPPLDNIDYSKTAYCSPDDTSQCHVDAD